MTKTLTIIITFILFASIGFSQDSNICSLTKKLIKREHINVNSVEIADGRTNGGIRNLLVSYTISTNSNMHVKELGFILDCLNTFNTKKNADLDEITVIIGDSKGKAVAIVNVKKRDAEQFSINKNSLQYVKKWNVSRYNKHFIPSLLSLANNI